MPTSNKSLNLARQYLDKQNLKIINHSPIGTIVRLNYINNNGILIAYETVITSNERSELLVRTKALRIDETDLLEWSSDSDDGFVADDELEK